MLSLLKGWDMVEWVKPQAYTAFGLAYPGDDKALWLLSMASCSFTGTHMPHFHHESAT